MGRYLERIEHTARYAKVNYFSAMDAPLSIKKSFMLASILRMNGKEFELDDMTEEQALYHIAFDKENPASVINGAIFARENARGSRDIISTELWEAINKYYHFVLKYDQEAFTKTHLYDFTQNTIERMTIVKGKIEGTMIHNEAWSIINLGFYVERAAQILRSVITKLEDIDFLREDKLKDAIYSHQIAAMLRGLEAFDMSRKFYRRPPNMTDSLEFLLLNDNFPRSFLYCMRKIATQVMHIRDTHKVIKGTVEFIANKRYCQVKYTTVEEIETNPIKFLLDFQDYLNELNEKIIEEIFFVEYDAPSADSQTMEQNVEDGTQSMTQSNENGTQTMNSSK